jgi:hypothetical protein
MIIKKIYKIVLNIAIIITPLFPQNTQDGQLLKGNRPPRAPQASDEKLIRFGYKIIGRIDEVDSKRSISDHFIDIKTTSQNRDTYFWDFSKYFIKISLTLLANDSSCGADLKTPFYIKGKIYLEAKNGARIDIGSISSEARFKTVDIPNKKVPIKIVTPREIELSVNGVDFTKKNIALINSQHEWNMVIEIDQPIQIKEIQYLSVNWDAP